MLMLQPKFYFFSVRYSKLDTIKNNFILYVMYGIAYPLAFFLNLLKISPNNITILSIVVTLVGCLLLVTGNNTGFMYFWGIAVVLDFCDGTVARMSNTVSKSAFRYDHMSDLFKISVIFLSVSIYYSDAYIWVLCYCALFIYLFYTVISHDLNHNQKLIKSRSKVSESEYRSESGGLKEKIKKNIMVYRVFVQCYSIFATINGHTLLLFLFLPLDKELATVILCYFLLLATSGMIINGLKLARMEKIAV
jgi:phosphatidylglycerophosphate synthase